MTDGFNFAPDMLHPRKNPACALFKSAKHNNRNVVLAVAGSGDSITAEILDYTNSAAGVWEQSK